MTALPQFNRFELILGESRTHQNLGEQRAFVGCAKSRRVGENPRASAGRQQPQRNIVIKNKRRLIQQPIGSVRNENPKRRLAHENPPATKSNKLAITRI